MGQSSNGAWKGTWQIARGNNASKWKIDAHLSTVGNKRAGTIHLGLLLRSVIKLYWWRKWLHSWMLIFCQSRDRFPIILLRPHTGSLFLWFSWGILVDVLTVSERKSHSLTQREGLSKSSLHFSLFKSCDSEKGPDTTPGVVGARMT